MTASATEACERLLEQYQRRPRPIQEQFRDLVPDVSLPDRATHMLHPYPAKLLSHIPIFFLSAERFSTVGDLVLDPFCGSGTVLLESVLSGRVGIGADSNPFARVLTEAKVTEYQLPKLRRASAALLQRLSAADQRYSEIPEFPNRDYWFHPRVAKDLARLLAEVRRVRDVRHRRLFEVTFSVVARRLSLANPRLSVPVRLRPDTYPDDHWFGNQARRHLRYVQRPDALGDLAQTLELNLRRVEALEANRHPLGLASVTSDDAREIRGFDGRRLPDGAVRLVLTSPPYPGAQKYIRSSTFSIGWLGLGDGRSLRELEELSIGREHFRKAQYEEFESSGIATVDAVCKRIYRRDPQRAAIASSYVREMRDSLDEAVRVLAPDGHLVLVCGANRLGGETFDTPRYLREILEERGLRVILELRDTIHSRGLMTRRNVTAGRIDQEMVTVFSAL